MKTTGLSKEPPGGGLVQLSANVPGPPVQVILPDAAPLRVEVPALAESDLLGTARLTGSDGTVLATLGGDGHLLDRETVVGGSATVAAVPAGVWTIRVEAPDGRRWSAIATTDGRTGASVRVE